MVHETVYFFCERTCKYISSDFVLTLLSRCMIVSIYNCHCRMWRSTVMLQTQMLLCFHNGNGAVPGAYLSKKKCKYIVQEVKVLKATLIIFLHKCNTKGGATLEMSAYLLVAYGRTENIRIHMYTFI